MIVDVEERSWHMPIRPEHYERHPLTPEERWAVAQSRLVNSHNGREMNFMQARQHLARLFKPLIDLFTLRHGHLSRMYLPDVLLVMQREMDRYGKSFWQRKGKSRFARHRYCSLRSIAKNRQPIWR